MFQNLQRLISFAVEDLCKLFLILTRVPFPTHTDLDPSKIVKAN